MLNYDVAVLCGSCVEYFELICVTSGKSLRDYCDRNNKM